MYYVPPSFYSQIVRLALAEKAVAHDTQFVIPGPPSFESYSAWYMRLNPNGTVPTLQHDGRTMSESRDILRYVDTRFGETRLWTERPDTGEVDTWIDRLYGIPVREMSYGSPRIRKLGKFINGKRLNNLHQRLVDEPELMAVYAAKIRDIEGFSHNALDEDHVAGVMDQVLDTLDLIDAAVTDRPFLAGDDYTMADLVWTVGVARLIMLGLSPLNERPALKDWYERMKLRPSFVEADVMEVIRPSLMLRVLWAKLKQSLNIQGPAQAYASQTR